jgi:hypothetical protein
VAKKLFKIVFPPRVLDHFDAIDLKYHSLIRQRIDEQLRFEPTRETRNRKPLLRKNEIGAEWEIRFGPDNRFRVLYNVDEVAGEVFILAIGAKHGNRLFVGDEEMKL